MASEPPANAGPNEAEESAPLPTSAEDRKAAAALSKLDENDDSSAPAKEVDADALGKAMKNLNVKEGAGEETKKKVKVDAVDVALLVKELDLTKGKATELLKGYEGDAVKAMTAFVSAPV